MQRIYLIIITIAAILGTSACSRAVSGEESGAAVRADVEAAIMEGRTAARAIVNVPEGDTLGMQSKLLDARARQSRYVTAGQKENAEAFDTAFMTTLRAVRPDIARDIDATR